VEEITSWTNILSDAGMAGAFIIFLVYDRREQAKRMAEQEKEQSRRMKEYVDRLLNILENIEKEREVGFDKVRDRYDDVIAKYDAERDKLLIDISGRIEEFSKAMHHGFEKIGRPGRGGS